MPTQAKAVTCGRNWLFWRARRAVERRGARAEGLAVPGTAAVPATSWGTRRCLRGGRRGSRRRARHRSRRRGGRRCAGHRRGRARRSGQAGGVPTSTCRSVLPLPMPSASAPRSPPSAPEGLRHRVVPAHCPSAAPGRPVRRSSRTARTAPVRHCPRQCTGNDRAGRTPAIRARPGGAHPALTSADALRGTLPGCRRPRCVRERRVPGPCWPRTEPGLALRQCPRGRTSPAS